MNKSAIFLGVAAIALASCNQEPQGDSDGGGDDVAVKFHPLEKFCIEYENTGLMSGKSIHCQRKWGAESYAIEDTKIEVGGMTQQQKSHNITIGDMIYAINPETMTGTKTKNPLFEQLAKSNPEELAKSIMASMQLEDTGEDKQVAGESCNVLKSPMGIGGCYTDTMVALEVSAMGLNRVATSVDLDSGGDDANYSLHEQAEITDGPDIGAILNSQ
ncbi:MAG: hypothetical protein P8J20_02930 [Novosphingobium sp.]|nr:hypothetical protein [Novosphingobium sp.]